MIISNKPRNPVTSLLHLYQFNAAREAFAKVISIAGKNKKILLPAFIGYSVREGSGIFDPVRNSGNDYEFYRMDAQLNVDPLFFKSLLERNKNSIVLFVHYWGFVDPSHTTLKTMARDNNCLIVEDFAHGLFTFFRNPTVDFDYGFFSLHKMFHYETGGVLISNSSCNNLPPYDLKFFNYNIFEISKKRIENYQYLHSRLHKLNNNNITVLRADIGESVPQTFPILLKSNAMKDFLYFKMNEAGFGVVSLYHQLISQVDDSYINEKDISARILNLPVHQDVAFDGLDEMVNFLAKACEAYEVTCSE